MVQFCKVLKYGIETDEPQKLFAFYDTISDNIISFVGEHLFTDKENFLLYAKERKELERYTRKIPVEFGGELDYEDISQPLETQVMPKIADIEFRPNVGQGLKANPLDCEVSLRAVFEKILDIINENKVIVLTEDFGDNTLTIEIDGRHTHCGSPSGTFEQLVDSLHGVLIDKKGLSWK